jgi:hypothetical protein
MSDYKTYMSLTDLESAFEITTILTNKGIPFKVEDTSKNFDASFSMNKADKSIMIFLDPKDFEKANSIIDNELVLNKNEINKEHFLYSFSTDELLDVIKNTEEWHPLDVKLAKEILKDRNYNLSDEVLHTLKKEKENELKEPEKNDIAWIIIGYLFSVLGGFIGFFIAYHLMTNKKTLPNGESIYSYSKSDRLHGRNMLIIASLSLLFFILYKFL